MPPRSRGASSAATARSRERTAPPAIGAWAAGPRPARAGSSATWTGSPRSSLFPVSLPQGEPRSPAACLCLPMDAGGGIPLSRREKEVAALVSEGLTDREIARRLFISERTAESHVRQIRNKLGFDNRAQV